MNDITSLKLELQFELDWMISTNDAYMHRVKKTKRGSYTTYTTKSPGLRDFQNIMYDKIKSQINAYNNLNIINKFKEYLDKKLYALSYETYYYMPIENYETSDVSNYIKCYEDCISSVMKELTNSKILDDKNNVDYLSHKRCSINNKWIVITTIYLVKRDSVYLELGGIINDNNN